MKAKRFLVLSAFLLLVSGPAFASGPLGICAIIERVVFEPSAQAPERVQVFGAFAFYDGIFTRPSNFSEPVRGYMYFRLRPGATDADLVRREWADLASVAGTGEAVAFGSYGYIGEFDAIRTDSLGNTGSGGYTLGFGLGVQAVRPDSVAAANPADYIPSSVGVVRVGDGNYDELVSALRSSLDR